jgi:hypothetical protein
MPARQPSPINSALEAAARATATYLAGRGTLNRVDQAVSDVALAGRASGVMPEELIIELKHMCSTPPRTTISGPEEFEEFRDWLVTRLIEVYFADGGRPQ